MNGSKKRKIDPSEEDLPSKHKGLPDVPETQIGKGLKADKKVSAKRQVTRPPIPGTSSHLPKSNEGGGSKNSTSSKQKGKATMPVSSSSSLPTKRIHKINKLVPPRPFPTVPTSVSATGPRSAHKEGKNFICLTRKTPLSAYLRRCKDVILKDGYKTLHLSAMGAAIPHLATLVVSLPSILPFAAEEIHTEILTGSVDVQDELIPEDEDEDISYKTRGKSTLMVVIKIGDGIDVLHTRNDTKTEGNSSQKHTKGSGRSDKGEGGAGRPVQIIFQEPEQDDMDIA